MDTCNWPPNYSTFGVNWHGAALNSGDGFHASEDKQTVREVAKDGLGVSRKESGDVGRYQLP